MSKIRSPLDFLIGDGSYGKHQNEYICNANTTPIWDDVRNAYMNEFNEMLAPPPEWKDFLKIMNVGY